MKSFLRLWPRDKFFKRQNPLAKFVEESTLFEIDSSQTVFLEDKLIETLYTKEIEFTIKNSNVVGLILKGSTEFLPIHVFERKSPNND
ncbi:MAG: hypothetical protein U5M51_04060 [Emticicia sp.]|nr:hypothetical protein [Emticicia sp.]